MSDGAALGEVAFPFFFSCRALYSVVLKCRTAAAAAVYNTGNCLIRYYGSATVQSIRVDAERGF